MWRSSLQWWAAGVACGMIAAPLLVGLSPVGRWLGSRLVVADPPARTDAIVVLGVGAYDPRTLTPDGAYRLLRALQLFREGYAPLLVLTGGSHRGVKGTDAEAMAAVARAFGVPAAALLVDPVPTSTRDQAVSVARMARDRGIASVLLVTTPLHSRRAAQAFRKTGLEVVSAPGPASPRLTVAQDHPAGRLSLAVHALYEYAALGLYAWRGWI